MWEIDCSDLNALILAPCQLKVPMERLLAGRAPFQPRQERRCGGVWYQTRSCRKMSLRNSHESKRPVNCRIL